jgi:hypothetical protein
MKKALISILLVATLLVAFIVPASAEAGALSANATFGEDKTTFTVNLVVENNPGFIAITADAEYDENVLTLKSANNGEIFESIFTPSRTLTDNPYKIIWMEATATEDIKTNGVLASYTFEIKNAAAEQTVIKFNISDSVNVKNEGNIPISGCSFTVDLKNMTGKSETATQSTNSSKVETIGATDNSSNTDSNQTESNDGTTITSPSDSIEDLDGKTQESNHTVVTILTIVVILVLGGVITVVAIYLRKKSSAKSEEK